MRARTLRSTNPTEAGTTLPLSLRKARTPSRRSRKQDTELAEELKVEADLRLEEDVRIVQANQEAIIESKKFANRSKKLELEERPYYVGEEEERQCLWA